jgi:hypothetical protein
MFNSRRGEKSLPTRLWIGALLAVLAAAACTSDGQGPTIGVACVSSGAPSYVDPLQGLYNRPASSVPNDVAVDYYTPGSTRHGKPRAAAR